MAPRRCGARGGARHRAPARARPSARLRLRRAERWGPRHGSRPAATRRLHSPLVRLDRALRAERPGRRALLRRAGPIGPRRPVERAARPGGRPGAAAHPLGEPGEAVGTPADLRPGPLARPCRPASAARRPTTNAGDGAVPRTRASGVSNVWRGVDEVPGDLGPTVVTIGVFDGVHRGHRAILDRALEAARTAAAEAGTRVPVVVVTFDPHPSEVVRPGSHPAMLSTLEHRVALLRAAGVDDVLVLHFSASLARLTPEEFVRDVLVDRLHAVSVVVGANFRFGHRAVGSVQTLAELGGALGFGV